jgi:hypothetical protein
LPPQRLENDALRLAKKLIFIKNAQYIAEKHFNSSPAQANGCA